MIEDANGIDHVVILDVLGSGSALIGIVEADAESLIVAIDALIGGAGGGDQQDIIITGSGNNGGILTGENAAEGNLHAPVHQLAIGIDSAFGLALGILIAEFDLLAGNAASLVDLLDGQFSAVLFGQTVVGIGAGEGADAADLDSGGVGGIIAAVVGGFAAAGGHGQNHENGHHHTQKLFHFVLLLCFC